MTLFAARSPTHRRVKTAVLSLLFATGLASAVSAPRADDCTTIEALTEQLVIPPPPADAAKSSAVRADAIKELVRRVGHADSSLKVSIVSRFLAAAAAHKPEEFDTASGLVVVRAAATDSVVRTWLHQATYRPDCCGSRLHAPSSPFRPGMAGAGIKVIALMRAELTPAQKDPEVQSVLRNFLSNSRFLGIDPSDYVHWIAVDKETQEIAKNQILAPLGERTNPWTAEEDTLAVHFGLGGDPSIAERVTMAFQEETDLDFPSFSLVQVTPANRSAAMYKVKAIEPPTWCDRVEAFIDHFRLERESAILRARANSFKAWDGIREFKTTLERMPVNDELRAIARQKLILIRNLEKSFVRPEGTPTTETYVEILKTRFELGE